MKMTKNRIVMVGIGGVAALAACVMGYLAISALMEKGEIDESLEMSESSYRKLAKAKIAPTAASAAAIASNTTVLAGWYDNVRREVAKGDVPVDRGASEAAFKQKMVDDARRLSKLPGDVVPEGSAGPGTLVKEGFPFGFGRYISGVDLPAKETLEALQREWSDVIFLAELLSRCGVGELVKLEVLSAQQAQRPEAVVQQPRPAQRGRKQEVEEKLCDEERYSVEFVARPAALVKTLNELASSKRFACVDGFEFFRQSDMISDALAGSGDKGEKASASSGGRRRGRRQRAQQEEKKSEDEGGESPAAKKSGFVTDPKKEAPFTVRMVIATCDFGTGGEAAAKPDEAPEGETAKEGDAAKDGNAAKEGDAVKEEVKQ